MVPFFACRSFFLSMAFHQNNLNCICLLVAVYPLYGLARKQRANVHELDDYVTNKCQCFPVCVVDWTALFFHHYHHHRHCRHHHRHHQWPDSIWCAHNVIKPVLYQCLILFRCFYNEHQMPHKHLNGTKFDFLTINHIPDKPRGQYYSLSFVLCVSPALKEDKWMLCAWKSLQCCVCIFPCRMCFWVTFPNCFLCNLPFIFLLLFLSFLRLYSLFSEKTIRMFPARFRNTFFKSVIHSNSKGSWLCTRFTITKDPSLSRFAQHTVSLSLLHPHTHTHTFNTNERT